MGQNSKIIMNVYLSRIQIIRLLGLLYFLLLTGCFIIPKSYNGYYIVTCPKSEARNQGMRVAHALSLELSRTLEVINDDRAGFQIILSDNRDVARSQAISVVVSYDNGWGEYTVAVRKRELGENAEMKLIKSIIERVIKEQGALWKYVFIDSSMAG